MGKGLYAKTGSRGSKPGYRTPSMFRNKVLGVVKKIPKGKTLSYKQVAEKAGFPKAYRAVGNLMNRNRDPEIPCHRVIKSDGTTGGFAFGSKKKIAILAKESIDILRKRR